jgi:hypothetical protein
MTDAAQACRESRIAIAERAWGEALRELQALQEAVDTMIDGTKNVAPPQPNGKQVLNVLPTAVFLDELPSRFETFGRCIQEIKARLIDRLF